MQNVETVAQRLRNKGRRLRDNDFFMRSKIYAGYGGKA